MIEYFKIGLVFYAGRVMKNITLILITTTFFALYSCSNQAGDSGKNKVYQVNLDNPESSVDLKLSDLVDSVRLIPLETTPESLLGPYLYYVYSGNKYILIYDINGMYKFSSDGRFIRKLFNAGRGPGEIAPMSTCYLYEKKDLLLIEERGTSRDYLYQYDVGTEKFLEPVKKYNSKRWTDFIVFQDSLIIGTLYFLLADPDPYALFIQNFKGKFVSGILSTKKISLRQNQEETVRRMRISESDKSFHLNYLYDDTLFAFDNNQLSSFMEAAFSAPREIAPGVIPEPGERKVSFPKIENSCFAILGETTFKEMKPNDRGTTAVYVRNYFLFDLNTGKSSKIKSYTDNFIDKEQLSTGETMNFPVILPNGRLYISYSPLELLGKNPGEQEWPEFPAGLSGQFTRIRKDLDEMDNPVLLVGIIKKKL